MTRLLPAVTIAAVMLLGCFVIGSEPASARTYVGEVGIEEDDVRIGKPEDSPYLSWAFPDRVLWGDTHVHTSYTTDAGMIGNYLGPDEAFRFARGETVTLTIH